MVEEIIDLIRAEAAALQEHDDRWIKITGTGAHDQSFQRGHAHGCVDAAALLDGRHRGAIAKMGHYCVERVHRDSEERGRLAARNLDGDPVEAVAPDPVS